MYSNQRWELSLNRRTIVDYACFLTRDTLLPPLYNRFKTAETRNSSNLFSFCTLNVRPKSSKDLRWTPTWLPSPQGYELQRCHHGYHDAPGLNVPSFKKSCESTSDRMFLFFKFPKSLQIDVFFRLYIYIHIYGVLSWNHICYLGLMLVSY